MLILLVILALAAVFCLLYRFIDRADQFFHPNKKTPESGTKNELPDDGGSEYLRNFDKFTRNDEEA